VRSRAGHCGVRDREWYICGGMEDDLMLLLNKRIYTTSFFVIFMFSHGFLKSNRHKQHTGCHAEGI
jgi:hypothetical protein